MKQYVSPNAQFLIPQTEDVLTLSAGDGRTVHTESFGIPTLDS